MKYIQYLITLNIIVSILSCKKEASPANTYENPDIEIEKIITHEFDFQDIQKAFDIVADYKDEVLKCIITNN